jgi:Zn-dependent protease with chaperone function
MSPTVQNILAVVAGAVACILLNGLLLTLMMKINPPPAGFNMKDTATFTLLQPRHLLSPFIAHALPSLIGGFIAAWIAASHPMTFALVVGGLHLIGGIAAAFMIPAPAWFIALDLIVAYLPMAWIGGWLAMRWISQPPPVTP